MVNLGKKGMAIPFNKVSLTSSRAFAVICITTQFSAECNGTATSCTFKPLPRSIFSNMGAGNEFTNGMMIQ